MSVRQDSVVRGRSAPSLFTQHSIQAAALLALLAWQAGSAEFTNPGISGPEASRRIIEQGIGRWRVFGGTRGSDVGAFAPDGRSFAAVFFRGVPSSGLNEYQLRHFSLVDGERWSESTLLTIETPGDDPAITSVRWINPGLIGLLGSPGGTASQVHTLEVGSGRLTQRTHSNTAVISYDISRDGNTLVYAAHTAPNASRPAGERLTGLVPRPEDDGWSFSQAADWGPDIDLYVIERGNAAVRRLGTISTGGSITAADLSHHGHAIRVSPDGRYAPMAPYFDPPAPASWKSYTTQNVRIYLDSYRIPPPTYARIDLHSGKIVPLGVPVASIARLQMVWSADSRRAFVAGFVPPEDPRFAEIDRESGAILSLEPATGEVTLVAPGTATIAALAEGGGSVTLVSEGTAERLEGSRMLSLIKVVKTGDVWRENERLALPPGAFHSTSAISATGAHVVGIVESSDSPTEVVVLDLSTRRARTITALNPGLAAIPRGRIEPRQDLPQSPDPWPAQLVEPVGYVAGQRYAAVVMHMDRIGYSDGYVLDSADYRATYPVQALASRGIAVLMVWFPRSYWPASGEEKRRRAREIADTAYDYLVDTRGVADPAAVAMAGFSHAGWVTEYGLQHTKRPYAAAIAIDNWTASYLQYVLSNSFPAMEDFYNGTSPYEDEGRKLWWDEAVGFNPQTSRVPLLKEVHGKNSPVASIAAWEIYSGRRRFGMPTELVYYPEGAHILRKVPEQISSAERQVDWLCFWLKGEEDPDPSKKAQYARWRMMKDGT